MRKHLRRYAVGALAIGAVAGGAAVALPGAGTGPAAGGAAVALPGTGTAPAEEWQPAPYGLSATPAQLLPSAVSTREPVRVVSTTLDKDGRPVVKVRTATDKAAAAELVKQAQKADNALGVEVDAPVEALADDPYKSMQWDLPKINTSAAQATSTGAGVVVAVIDSGVDAAHPDLAGQVLPGIDYITGTTGTSVDPHGHGTHVAGTIAALTGNGVGVASIAPGVRILPIRTLDAQGRGVMSDTASGIVWAADHGADVINMSLGGTSQVSAVTTAISYARGKGVTVVAAAGNSRASGSPTSYPGADPGVIGVAATDSADKVATFSNQGSYVDVAAPGVNIASTYPTGLGSYTYMSGTSMASPHVAAVAALLKGYNRNLTPDQVQAALESSAVDLGTTGKDTDFGYGRIDAAAALAKVTGATSPPTVSPTAAPTKTATATPTKTATPTPTVAKTVPVVTVSPATKQVTHGTSVATTFTVKSAGKALANTPVQVCVTEAGGSAVCTAATTGKSGTVAVKRTATTGYTVHVVVAATATTAEVTSPAATVTVKATVKVSRSKTSMTVTMTGVAGQTVEVQQLVNKVWTTVGDFPAAARTTVGDLVLKQKYRVVVPDTAGILGATSSAV
ncbi:S8 family peptidase [Paractinoplanes atraurantiacus]|uniref:Type VII secretion-associated serine protease mycosin n=1 Tax=Paractinoplanes atraurantiacus TaxID=1036182 RepID=A0A285JZG2_9ACTN|nr:S8 family peptidase [Actinoplanes atraurantiacus]SNY65729.1 type VII secretion-associated serine protease mycosin [Actinoplanes atraurantiacus]